MKKQILLIVALSAAICLSAQTNKKSYAPFYTKEEAPHLENVLPAPPELNSSRYYDDWCQYLWGKSIRDTERGELAVKDAGVGASYFFKRFAEPMHRELTQEEYPILFELLSRAHMTEMQAGDSAKKYFKRVRPYQLFKEPTGLPTSENPTDFTSYPSGHTHISWLAGLILTSIDPAHTEGIMKVAYELGQSRVILGFHYQSDIEAGRYAGSITFARLCADPEFMRLLEKAKEEFAANSK